MKCPLCGLDTTYILLKEDNSIYNRCKNCSFVFLVSHKTVKYQKNYLVERGSDLFNSSIAKAKRKTIYHYLKKVSVPDSGDEVVLDIGCSTGLMLKVIKDMGYSIYGVDINKDAVAKAKDYLKEENIFWMKEIGK